MTISPPPVAIGEVRSEVGRLRRVLVHRPGRELDRLTAANAEELLFDEVLRADRARAEHDALTATLAAEGVEVFRLVDLLAGALRGDLVRREAIALALAGWGGERRAALVARLEALPAPDLALALIEGLPGDGAPAIAPLPNQMFVRDSSAWLSDQLVLGTTANPVRAREADLVRLAYLGHPVFGSRARDPIVLRPEGVEGGDLFTLRGGVALLGVGSRSSCRGAEALAAELFAAGFERLLAVRVPDRRDSIHLDCLMTLVDADVLLADRRLLAAPVVEMLPPGGAVESRTHADLPSALAGVLGGRPRVVEVADAREQWMLAANTVAVAPGRVVSYAHNVRTNEALASAGVEVLPVPGEELYRGRGGPRCLTCPLSRDHPA